MKQHVCPPFSLLISLFVFAVLLYLVGNAVERVQKPLIDPKLGYKL